MELKKVKSNSVWFLFSVFAIGIGLYPIIYVFTDDGFGLLGSKTAEVLSSYVWQTSFYIHITFGGIALLSGFSQFSKKLRRKKLKLHKSLGKVYISSVLLSGISGLYIALYATGGFIASLGFSSLAVLWLGTTLMAYSSILKKNIIQHQMWMIRSYALCFAAVKLRLWLPFFIGFLKMEFIPSYLIIAWLCWIPNLFIAEIIVHYQLKKLISR